jgi:hypothetical protein
MLTQTKSSVYPIIKAGRREEEINPLDKGVGQGGLGGKRVLRPLYLKVITK